MRQQFFLFIECEVGRAREIASTLQKLNLPFCTEIALVSGEWDLLIRSEFDVDLEIDKVLVAPIQSIDGVSRTWTEIGYPIFDPQDVYFDPDGD